MGNPKPLKSAQIKGGKTTGPRKVGFMREELERLIFGDGARFETWVDDNFTEAVKELGKLQPKNVTLAGDNDNPLHIIERVILEKAEDRDS
jgi:hypothetical protein